MPLIIQDSDGTPRATITQTVATPHSLKRVRKANAKAAAIAAGTHDSNRLRPVNDHYNKVFNYGKHRWLQTIRRYPDWWVALQAEEETHSIPSTPPEEQP